MCAPDDSPVAAAAPTPAGPLFRGAGVALLTLFDADGRLLTGETAAFAATLTARGAAAVLVAGTTGEFWTLDDDERLSLVAAVRRAVPASVPVIAGIGALQASRALALAERVRDTGADAALCFVPLGEEPVAFYGHVRDAVGDLPLLGYHFPQVGYAPLAADGLGALPIDGIKDSSGEPGRLLAARPVLPHGTYTGSALLLTLAAALGLPGGLLALGNLEPALAQAAAAGDVGAQGRLADVHAQLAAQPAPVVLKRLVAQRYGTPAWTRGPTLREASSAQG
jgi:4-hydroxy-tetrahydrodipicolinate synthase